MQAILARGQVYLVPFRADDLARQARPIAKLAVILQSQLEFPWKARVMVVLATSNVDAGRHQPWNVVVPAGRFVGFPRESLIVCADLYPLPVATVRAGRYLGLLPPDVMVEVDDAIAVGLQLAGTIDQDAFGAGPEEGPEVDYFDP